jgi:hypothetical protein
MTEEELKRNRGFVADLVKELFDVGNLDHLDGYGGALFTLDVEEAMEALRRKGWTTERRKIDGGE